MKKTELLTIIQKFIFDFLKKSLNNFERKQKTLFSHETDADENFQFPSKKYPLIKQKKIEIENEFRNALLSPVPISFEYNLDISKGDILEFGIGVERDTQINSMRGFLFRVNIQNNNDEKNLIFSKFLIPNSIKEDKQWLDAKINLSQYLGENRRIKFQCKAIPSIKKRYDEKIAWSYPIIYKENEEKKKEDINIILISIDDLRFDHLGCYGYFKNTSPNIDNFAKDSILFENAISQSHWTIPSHMSMLTSLYPTTHKINVNRKLEKSIETLPEVLRRKNYLCFGFSTSFMLSPEFGFARGFDYYINKAYDFWSKIATCEEVTLRTMNFLNENKCRKNFIFLHYFDVHSPFISPNPYNIKFDMTYNGIIRGRINDYDKFANRKKEITERDLKYTISLYDGEILHLDYYIGILINQLKSLGKYENSLIIITSDHGEEFFEHGNIDHKTLYDEVIRIPLIIKLPGWMNQKNKKITELVQGTIDIFPTILDVVRIPIPIRLQGKSVLPLINKSNEIGRNLFEEAYSEHLNISYINEKEYGLAIRTPKYKYIYKTYFDVKDFTEFKKVKEEKELYDIQMDRYELNNLVNREKDLSENFQNKIDEFISNTSSHNREEKKEILDQKIRELKILRKI